MKKKFIIIVFIIVTSMLISYNSYAAAPRVASTVSQKETSDGKIQVEISLSEMENIDGGVNAFSGKLEFDSNQLTLLEINEEGSWNTPLYNSQHAKEGYTKVVGTSNQFIKNTGKIFVATFEKKSTESVSKVKFDDFEVAAKVEGKTLSVAESDSILETTTTNENMDSSTKSLIILATLISAVLLTLGLLFIGFGYYRKNKGGEK